MLMQTADLSSSHQPHSAKDNNGKDDDDDDDDDGYDDDDDGDDDDDDDDDDGDDLYIIGAVCLSVRPSRFSLFHFLPFLDTFGSKI